jgi:hypothetical protein
MSEDWKIIRRFGADEEATLVVGFLRSHDIPAEVESLLFHQEPVTFGQLGDVRVRVPPDYAEAAEELLARLDRGEIAIPAEPGS